MKQRKPHLGFCLRELVLSFWAILSMDHAKAEDENQQRFREVFSVCLNLTRVHLTASFSVVLNRGDFKRILEFFLT